MTKPLIVDGLVLASGRRFFQDLDPRPMNERVNGTYTVTVGEPNVKNKKPKHSRKNTKILSSRT